MKFFKQTRWLEAYFEAKECGIPDRFFNRRSENGDHEFWLGRYYLSIHFYRRKVAANGVDNATA
jgi:hypothetical protein